MQKKPSADELVGRHAARHHGLVTRRKALAVGLTDRQIAGRVRDGRWERVGAGVYRIAGAPLSAAQVLLTALLAAGPGAAAAGISSLALLGVGAHPLVPRIAVPPSSSARTPNAIVRRSPITEADLTWVGPIRATAPGRALLEAAAHVEPTVLDDLVDDVLVRTSTTTSHVLGAIRRSATGSGREGVDLLRRSLEPWLSGVAPESPAEVRLIRRLLEWRLPEPVRQHVVRLADDQEVRLDLAWPDRRVGLEYDGERFHGPRRLRADVEREEALRAAGWWVGRVDRHDLSPSSTRVRDELAPRLLEPAA
jgi:very-short-patch-repair endonuclease